MQEREIKILSIDDDEAILCSLKAVMESQEWTALTAANIRDAIAVYEKEKPDLILIDYHMPEINGVQGVKYFRRMDLHIPIIVFTIDEDQETADMFLAAGATDFATKPIKASDIISRIRLHIKLMESREEKGGGGICRQGNRAFHHGTDHGYAGAGK